MAFEVFGVKRCFRFSISYESWDRMGNKQNWRRKHNCLTSNISPRPFYMVRRKSSMSVGGFSHMSPRPHTEHSVAEGLLVLRCLRFVLPILFLPSKAQRHALPCISQGPHRSPCHLQISCPAKANRQHNPQ